MTHNAWGSNLVMRPERIGKPYIFKQGEYWCLQWTGGYTTFCQRSWDSAIRMCALMYEPPVSTDE